MFVCLFLLRGNGRMKKNFYLFKAVELGRRDNTIVVNVLNENDAVADKRFLPIEGVADIFAFGPMRLNSALVNFLGQVGIGIHFFDYHGNYTGSFAPRAQQLAGRVLVAQVAHYTELSKRKFLASQLVMGAAQNMARNLKYYATRGREHLSETVAAIGQMCELVPAQPDVQHIMAQEAHIRKAYYACFESILDNRMHLDGRTYNPPHNGLNALISFLNMLCYVEMLRAIRGTALEPTIGYLHEPGERRFSLALDLAEIFKPLMVDRLVFSLVNKGTVTLKSFEEGSQGFLLKESVKKAVVAEWDERLKTTIEHRKLKRKVSYRTLLKMEAHKITKHVMGISVYKPFKIWW